MSSSPQYVRHTPGTPSRSGVLDVGLKCLHRCLFCYYSNLDGEESAARKGFRSGADCREIVSEMSRQGLTQFDVTGGEPSLHPELPEILRHAASLGMASRVITLGQNLMSRKGGTLFVDTLIDAGVTSFLFSAHAVEEGAFKDFTNASWARLRQAMDHLDERGFQYCLNTVVFSGNQHMLPDIARESVAHGVYSHNFILFNPYYEWKNHNKAFAVQSRYPEVRPFLTEAVRILEAAGVAVNVRYAPLCAFPEVQKNIVGVVGVQFDPHEWRNRAGNHDKLPAFCAEPLVLEADGVREIYALHHEKKVLENGMVVVARRGDDFKYFPEACAQCTAMEACDGLDINYLLNNGALKPLVSPMAGPQQSAPITDARAAYGPAFLLKRAQFADMKAAVIGEMG